MTHIIKSFYEDQRFTVTSADIKTPSIIYPISDAVVARVRHDIQYSGLGFAALIGLALILYFDLWFWYERIMLVAVIGITLFASHSFAVLQIDARGYPSRLFFAPSKTIRRLFEAISQARADQPLGTKKTYQDFEHSES